MGGREAVACLAAASYDARFDNTAGRSAAKKARGAPRRRAERNGRCSCWIKTKKIPAMSCAQRVSDAGDGPTGLLRGRAWNVGRRISPGRRLTVVVCLWSDCLGLKAGAAKNKGRAGTQLSRPAHGWLTCAHTRLGTGNMTWRRRKKAVTEAAAQRLQPPVECGMRPGDGLAGWLSRVVLEESGGGRREAVRQGREGVWASDRATGRQPASAALLWPWFAMLW